MIPCFLGEFSPSSFITDVGPAFAGPGTFVKQGFDGITTVTITDVPSGAPEPSSLALLPIGIGALLLTRKRIRPLAV